MRLVTVATHDNVYLQNWLTSARRAGHKGMVVLGLGEEWGGWAWRAKTLSDFFSSADATELFVCLDAYDVFVLGSPSDFEKAFSSKCDKELKVGVEKQCFTVAPCKFAFEFNGIQTFPNGGCVSGSAAALASLYQKLQHYEDDQIGVADLLSKQEVEICPDGEHNVVYNLNHMINHQRGDTHYAFFVLDWIWNLILAPWYVNEDRVKVDNSNRLHVRHSVTGDWVTPAALHMPGSSGDFNARYNYFASKLGLEIVDGLNPLSLPLYTWLFVFILIATAVVLSVGIHIIARA